MDAVVPRFGLKAEGPLRVRIGGPAESLVLAPVGQSDLVAPLLLHALRQAADGDLAANTEPAFNKHQEATRLLRDTNHFLLVFV